MMDPIERGEARAEAYYFNHVAPDGKLACAGCGTFCNPGDMCGSSPDPYSSPICGPECPALRQNSGNKKPPEGGEGTN